MFLTFLVTDVEASTRTARELADSYQELIRDQARILREAMSAGGADLIRTEGDAVIAAFSNAGAAVIAAVQAQLKLQEHEWPGGHRLHIRMGIHSGEAVLSGSGHVGTGVSEAARVGGAAYGDQILISEVTVGTMGSNLPDGVSLETAGRHKLKGFDRPIELFQICHPDLRQKFPPVGGPNIHLPLELTSFVGREKETDELIRALEEGAQIVTLTGPGGTGKTRLAVQVAQTMASHYADGIWFVDLAPLDNPQLVVPTIARTLGVREIPGRPLTQSIAEFLKGKATLLLLDNFEHLLESAAIVAQLLSDGPDSRILVTSRAALEVAGERVFAILPLSSEAAKGGDEEPAALKLFRERARTARPKLEMNAGEIEAALAICQRLDGLPLAIELAAAQVRVLSPQEILLRLAKRVPLLSGAARDQPARRRALASTIEWSFELLAKPEASLFCQLAVFRGGFTAESATAVCTSPDIEPGAVTALLESLVGKSLVVKVSTRDRFTLLQTIQDYALDRLESSGEAADVKQRHAIHYLDQAEELSPGLHTSVQLSRLETFDLELDNYRSALALFSEKHGEEMLRLVVALSWYWILRTLGEGRDWYAKAPIDDHDLKADLRAAALAALGRHKLLREADPKAADDVGTRLAALASSCHERIRWEGWSALLWALGAIENSRVARPRATEAVAKLRQAGEPWELAMALNIAGEVERGAGDVSKAMRFYGEALDQVTRTGDRVMLATLRMNMGESFAQLGDLENAMPNFEKAMSLAREVGNDMQMALCVVGLGAAIVTAGRAADGVLFLGAAINWVEERGWRLQLVEQMLADQAIQIAQDTLEKEEFAEVFAAGRNLTLEQAVELYSEAVPTHSL